MSHLALDYSLLKRWKECHRKHKKFLEENPYEELDEHKRADKEITLAALARDARYLKLAPQELQNDKEVVLVACSSHGKALKYASEELQNDKEVVLLACAQDGSALKHAPENLRADKEVVMAACSNRDSALKYASELLRADKEVLACCSEDSKEKQICNDQQEQSSGKDKEFSPAHLHKSTGHLQIKEDRNKVKEESNSLQPLLERAEECYNKHKDFLSRNPYAKLDQAKKSNKEIALARVFHHGWDLEHAPEELRDDRDVVLVACARRGHAFQFASSDLRNDREVVLAVCSENGYLLQYASEALRSNKEVVMVAVESKPESLKFALGGLNQDKDCLIKAGLWDEDYEDRNHSARRAITLSKNPTKRLSFQPDSPFQLRVHPMQQNSLQPLKGTITLPVGSLWCIPLTPSIRIHVIQIGRTRIGPVEARVSHAKSPLNWRLGCPEKGGAVGGIHSDNN